MTTLSPNHSSSGPDRFFAPVRRLLDALFKYPRDRFSLVVCAVWIAGVWLFGLYLWNIFFSGGNLSFDFLDWAEVTGPRYALLKDAATHGLIPLHAANTTALRGVTDRYFAIADTPFSPQYLLLRFMGIGQYLFVDTLLWYTVGFIGLILILRRYRLSPFAFLLMALLFDFNGSMTGHLAVGHSIWVAEFLLPFFVLLVMRLIEGGQAGWRWVLGLSLLLLTILLQGGFHLFLWCLVFLGVLGLFNLRLLRPVLLGGLFSVLLSLGRLLPPALSLSGIQQQYLGGFATVTDLLAGLVVLKDPDKAMALPSKIFPLGWWELDFFVGLLGFALLVIFGILLPLRHERSKSSVTVQVLFPSLVLAALSLGQVFAMAVRVLPVPPLTGERVTSRMLVLPLAFVLVQAMIYLQCELDRRASGPWLQITFLGLAGVLYHDLSQHMQAWRIRYLDGLTYLFPKVAFNATQHHIANHPDPLYTGMLLGGAIAGVLALVFLLVMAFREKRAQAKVLAGG